MRTFTQRIKILLLALGSFFLLTTPTKACVDWHTTVFVTCHYDTVNFTDIAITVSNLRLFGGNPNEFCSCAITNWTNIFSQINYVAFVDSGTTNPLPGFDVWNADANATNSWESVLATGDWSGYVSSVNGAGLPAGQAVELIIRASLPMGYTFSLIDSSLTVTQLGTDEWDNTNQTLANSHQSITGFWTGGQPTYIAEYSSTYFDDLDNAILTSVADRLEEKLIEVGPVPAKDRLYVHLRNDNFILETAEVFNMSGQKVMEIPLAGLHSGRMELDVSAYPNGVYFLKLQTQQGVQTEKIVIQH